METWMPETWMAFVINQTETDYTIISERDKQYHTLPLPIRFGNTRLPDGSVVNIQETIFSPHQIFMACKGYVYDLVRKRQQYQKRRTLKKKQPEENLTNPFYGATVTRDTPHPTTN